MQCFRGTCLSLQIGEIEPKGRQYKIYWYFTPIFLTDKQINRYRAFYCNNIVWRREGLVPLLKEWDSSIMWSKCKVSHTTVIIKGHDLWAYVLTQRLLLSLDTFSEYYLRVNKITNENTTQIIQCGHVTSFSWYNVPMVVMTVTEYNRDPVNDQSEIPV